MRSLVGHLPHRRGIVVLDVVLALWAAAWLAAGIAVAREADGLTRLSDTVSSVGVAVEDSGRALEALGSVPLVGERVDQPAERIRAAGASARASGRTSRESIKNLGLLLGVAIALVPSVPLLALYVPLRIAALRERRTLERLLRTHGDDPRLLRLLGQRALATLPYTELRDACFDGPGGASGSSTRRLAAAELERLDIEEPAPR